MRLNTSVAEADAEMNVSSCGNAAPSERAPNSMSMNNQFLATL